jgi:hypothetical protein
MVPFGAPPTPDRPQRTCDLDATSTSADGRLDELGRTVERLPVMLGLHVDRVPSDSRHVVGVGAGGDQVCLPAGPEYLRVAFILMRSTVDHPEKTRRMGRAAQTRVRRVLGTRVMCALIEQTYARLLGLPEAPRASGASPDTLSPLISLRRPPARD